MTLTLGLIAFATLGVVASVALACLCVVKFPVYVAALLGLVGLLAAGWTGQLSALVTLAAGACLYGLYGLLRFVCERPPLAALVIVVLSAGCVRAAIEGARVVAMEPARALQRPALGRL